MVATGPAATALDLLPASISKKRAVRESLKPALSGLWTAEQTGTQSGAERLVDAALTEEATAHLRKGLDDEKAALALAMENIDPRVVLDSHGCATALRSVHGSKWLLESGIGNVLWLIAAAGSGSSTDTVHHVLTAVVRLRAISYIASLVADSDPAEYRVIGDGELLFRTANVSFRAEWVARRVLRELAKSTARFSQGGVLEDQLLSYVKGHIDRGWTAEDDLDSTTSPELDDVLQAISIEVGGLRHQDPWSSLTSRSWMTHPVVRFGDRLLPLAGRALLYDPHIAVVDLLKRSAEEDAGAAFEQCCAGLLADARGVQVFRGDVYVKVGRTDPGEVDVLCVGSAGRILVLECKSAGVQRTVESTATSLSDVLGSAAAQLQKRLQAFESGEAIRYPGGEIESNKDISVVGVVVTQHEYGGFIWSRSLTDAVPLLMGRVVLTLHDLALLVFSLETFDELHDYLSWRAELLGTVWAADEIDLLKAYLGRKSATIKVRPEPGIVPPCRLPTWSSHGLEGPLSPADFRRLVRLSPDAY